LSGFTGLLRGNRNYRFTWTGQVVSEVGDHYNNVAVFALALANTGSGLVVAGILISRAICAVLAGPIAGVLLDRMDRKRIMIISDLVRAAVAILFILGIPQGRTWLLYVLSGALMFASPFFSSGRASILPTIATKHELHSANSLTQLTQWTTLTLGSFLGGTSVSQFGYRLAFFFNAMSFLFSAWCISQLHVESGFRAERDCCGSGSSTTSRSYGIKAARCLHARCTGSRTSLAGLCGRKMRRGTGKPARTPPSGIRRRRNSSWAPRMKKSGTTLRKSPSN
jgi:MFS family permease